MKFRLILTKATARSSRLPSLVWICDLSQSWRLSMHLHLYVYYCICLSPLGGDIPIVELPKSSSQLYVVLRPLVLAID